VCDEYFETVFLPTNLCVLLDGVFRYKVEHYEEKVKDALRLFSFDVEQIMKSDGFSKMCVPAMKFFLASDHVFFPEDDIWKAVKTWAQYQSDHFQELNKAAIAASLSFSLPPLCLFDLMWTFLLQCRSQ